MSYVFHDPAVFIYRPLLSVLFICYTESVSNCFAVRNASPLLAAPVSVSFVGVYIGQKRRLTNVRLYESKIEEAYARASTAFASSF